MTPRVWPRSLAARTASVLLVGLIIVQAAGLAIHAFDRIDLQRLAQEREIAVRVMNIYRTVMLTPPDQREAVLGELRHSPDLSAELVQHPPTEDLPDALPFRQRLLRVNLKSGSVDGRAALARAAHPGRSWQAHDRCRPALARRGLAERVRESSAAPSLAFTDVPCRLSTDDRGCRCTDRVGCAPADRACAHAGCSS